MRRRRWLLASLLVAIGAGAGVAIDRCGASWIPIGPEAQVPPPNLDFAMMAIATRPVDVSELGGAPETRAKVHVKAWERCALGAARCDTKRRTVEAHCLGSGRVVRIDEKDWPAFQRIPGEDLQGMLNTPEDMNLCGDR